VSVTFTMTNAGLGGRRLTVVGDFNGWDPGANPMEHHDGSYTATIALERGRYRFRYLSEDGSWFNDDAADAYEDNEHGGHDSVLDLTDTVGGRAEHPDDPQAAAVDQAVPEPGTPQPDPPTPAGTSSPA
jgi:1,4-alpha-glucan branching enzyme